MAWSGSAPRHAPLLVAGCAASLDRSRCARADGASLADRARSTLGALLSLRCVPPGSRVGVRRGETCHRPPGIDALISLGDYSGPAGQAARLIKGTCWTDGAWWWGSALGPQLLNPAHGTGRARIGAASGEDATSMIPPGVVLVPVPGDRLRTLLRGIDHATALTRAVSAACGWPWRSLLVRQDRTRQASRRARKRREIQGRFSMQSNRDPIPERVLLVDDICTTGATAADCARAVRLAGAEWVSLGVLARAHR